MASGHGDSSTQALLQNACIRSKMSDITSVPTQKLPALQPTPTRSKMPDITSAPAQKLPASKCSLTSEMLPTPLFILGDIRNICLEMFALLSYDPKSPLLDVYVSTDEGIGAPISPSRYTISSISTEGSLDDEDFDVAISFSEGVRRISKPNQHIRANSDEYFKRKLVPVSLLSSLPITSNIPSDLQRLDCQFSACSNTPTKTYVLHMPRIELDPHFLHLYLRTSGIYLVLIDLQEMADDPLIQFENLCYWLRLIETYVTPNFVKRIIIVGVYETTAGPQYEQIQKCIEFLNTDLREAEFKQIMAVSHGNYILQFNKYDRVKGQKNLLTCVIKCMDAITERLWNFERETFDCVLRPFAGFASVLTKLSTMKEVVASPERIEKLYEFSDPLYFKTLAAYSSACICTTGMEASLLRPSFMIYLLLLAFADQNEVLENFPIVSALWVKKQMDCLLTIQEQFLLHPADQDLVLQWAEKLELMFNIGKGKDGVVNYFVPFLATGSRGDRAIVHWSEEEAAKFSNEDSIVLYAELNIPATQHFFYRLIAELLRNAIKDAKNKCYINVGCTEAILPLDQFTVLLRYHPLQNIIEFRTRVRQKEMELYDAVRFILMTTLLQSKYSSDEEAFKFSVPATELSNSHRKALWQLEEDQERLDAKLLKTKPFSLEEMAKCSLADQQEKEKGLNIRMDTDLVVGIESNFNFVSASGCTNTSTASKVFSHYSCQHSVSKYYHCAERIAHVPFLDEVTILGCDSTGREYVNIDHGITLKIPEGAIPKGLTVHFEIAVALYGPFKFTANQQPISPILWLCPQEEVELLKPIEVTLPHFLTGLTDEDSQHYGVTFAKADHNDYIISDEKSLYQFQPYHASTNFSSDGEWSYGTLQSNHCCFLCIKANQSKEVAVKKGYTLSRVDYSVAPLRDAFHFCVIFSLPSCSKLLCEQYPTEEGYVINHQRRFKFSESSEIQLEFPSNLGGKCSRALDPHHRKIRVSDIDFWECDCEEMEYLHSVKLYPPRVKLTVAVFEDSQPFPLLIKFAGCAKDGDLDQEILLPLGKNTSPILHSPRSNSLKSQTGKGGQSSLDPTSSPELKELMQLAHRMPTKWFDLGIALYVPYEKLEGIEFKHDKNSKRCYGDLFNEWKKQRSPRAPYTWATIVEALKDSAVGEELLALELEGKFQSP